MSLSAAAIQSCGAETTAEADGLARLPEILAGLSETTRFLALIHQADLDELLEEAEQLTVFAPSNEAFATLAPHLQRYYFSDTPASRSRLRDQLKYTMAPALVTSASVKEGKLETLHGSKAYIEPVDDGRFRVDRATTLRVDIGASNGVIHVIDKMNLSNLWK